MGTSRGTSRRASIVALSVAILFAGACRDRHTVRVSSRGRDGDVKFVARDSSRPLGPGDLRITTQDGGVEVAIIGDSLVAGLGPTARAKVKASTDTNNVSSSGFGASIEKMVKSTVASALDHEIHYPLAEVSDVQ